MLCLLLIAGPTLLFAKREAYENNHCLPVNMYYLKHTIHEDYFL